MKITHFFILNDEDSNPFSGAENHLWELLKGISKVNVDTELLVALRQTGKVIDKRLEELRINGVKVSLLDRKNYKFSSCQLRRIFSGERSREAAEQSGRLPFFQEFFQSRP